jgi:hypothetical protein
VVLARRSGPLGEAQVRPSPALSKASCCWACFAFFFVLVGHLNLPDGRCPQAVPSAVATVARGLLARPVGSYGGWPRHSVIAGTSGTSAAA